MVTVRATDFGSKLIDDYSKVFGSYSFKNEMYGKISLHVLIGQLLKNVYYRVGARKIDIRVHLLLIKPQGSGKGAGYGFIERVATDLGLEFRHVTKSTGAALAGSNVVDPSTKKPVEKPGILKTADIVGMEEASPLFDLTDEFSKMNMTYFQITMNPLEDTSCRITIDLLSGDIDYKPHASLVMTSYPPDKLVDKLIKTGFIDRMIAVFEDVTLVDRLEVIKKMSENINQSTTESFQAEYKKLVQRLEVIVKKFQKGNICVTVPEKIDKLMLQIIDEFAMKILDASPKAREKLEHFVSRLYENLMKLSIHHSLLSLRTTVEIEDVLYARLTYMDIWRNLIISIESLLIISPIERSRRHRIIRTSIKEYDKQIKLGKHVKEKVWVRRPTMVTNLQQLWDNCSLETADNNLRKLEKLPELEFKKVARYEKDKFFQRKYFGDVAYLKKIKDVK